MASCELKVIGKNPFPPLGKLKIDDDNGYLEWTFIPIAANGSVRTGKGRLEGQNTVLLNGPGKFAGKPYGTLINFSVHHYNKNITYTLHSGKHNYRCKSAEGDSDMNMDF